MSNTGTTNLSAMTDAATPLDSVWVWNDHQVVASERMPSFTVGLPLVDSLNALASQEILTNGDELDMVWIDANANSAQMIGDKIGWARPDNKFVSEPMGTVAVSIGPNKAVPVFIGGMCPQPAVSKVRATGGQGAVLVNPAPEPHFFSYPTNIFHVVDTNTEQGY